MENKPSQQKVRRRLQGVVITAKAEKTVAVVVERMVQHRVYKKIIRRKAKYLAHDEGKKCQVGDKVVIQLVRPLSKLKRWLVVDVVERAADKEV